MRKRPTLLFYCQHLRGLGHLTRSLALAVELSRRFKLVLLSGGKVPKVLQLPPEIEVVQLPPIEMSPDGQLHSSDKRRSLARTIELRGQLILEIFERLRPDVIVIELYPFGRVSFSSELLPLLEAAHNAKTKRPLVFCSLRDITGQMHSSQQVLDDIACVVCNHLFDAVLFHADPHLARLEESFRSAVTLTTPVHYTGFVVPSRDEPPRCAKRSQEVIVSAGGGSTGGQLLLAAVEAYAKYGIGDGIRMTIASGPILPDAEWHQLKTTAAGLEGLRVRRWIPNMMNALAHARASVSQCGYNTSLDLLRARVPALLVPFVGDRDKEQSRRARKMEQLGTARVLEPDRLNPRTLAAEIRATLDFQPAILELDMNGAAKSASIIERMLQERGP